MGCSVGGLQQSLVSWGSKKQKSHGLASLHAMELAICDESSDIPSCNHSLSFIAVVVAADTCVELIVVVFWS